MSMPELNYRQPRDLAEAVTLLQQLEQPRLLAGGTDLIPNLRRGLGRPGTLVDLSQIAALQQLEWQGDELHLGAGLTLEALIQDAEINARLPALAQAARAVAGPSHRAVATLGGNLCQETRCVFYNQSEWWRRGNDYCLKHCGERCHVVVKSDRCYATYHGDLAPVLMALGARVRVLGPEGERSLALADLYREDGRDGLTLAADEVLTGLTLAWDARRAQGYDKARVRDAVDFALAGVAVALKRDGEVLSELRVAVTGAGSAPRLLIFSELEGQPWTAAAAELLLKRLRKEVTLLKTTLMGAKYRRRVLLAMTGRLVDRLWAEDAPRRKLPSRCRLS